jgi:hypothetical protein
MLAIEANPQTPGDNGGADAGLYNFDFNKPK